MLTLFSLMIENESPLLKNLLNDFSHIFKTSHIKKLIKIMNKQVSGEAVAKALELLLSSQAFK